MKPLFHIFKCRQTVGSRQCRTMTSERRKTSEVSPAALLDFCLGAISCSTRKGNLLRESWSCWAERTKIGVGRGWEIQKLCNRVPETREQYRKRASGICVSSGSSLNAKCMHKVLNSRRMGEDVSQRGKKKQQKTPLESRKLNTH